MIGSSKRSIKIWNEFARLFGIVSSDEELAKLSKLEIVKIFSQLSHLSEELSGELNEELSIELSEELSKELNSEISNIDLDREIMKELSLSVEPLTEVETPTRDAGEKVEGLSEDDWKDYEDICGYINLTKEKGKQKYILITDVTLATIDRLRLCGYICKESGRGDWKVTWE